MADQPPGPDLSRLYRDTRERLSSLLTSLDEAALAAPVPACPRWVVRDVVAHLAAVPEDVLAGRLTQLPTEEFTAAQVARFAGCSVADMLARWAQLAPQFERLVGEARVWPSVMDVASHEQDIRGAVGKPGARDTEVVRECAGRLLRSLRPPVPLTVRVEDAEFAVGPEPGEEPVLSLTTTRFEAFRWRLGRRSRAQLTALDWSGDPAPVLAHLVIFGPAAADVIE